MDAATLSMLPPKLLAQYLRDPQSLGAQKMIEEGSETSPVQSPWQGVARMVKGGIGGYMAQKLKKQYDDQADAAKAERSQAMAIAAGKPAETQKYEDGTTINWNEQKPNFMGAAGMLQSPDNEGLATKLLGAQVDQDQQSRLFGQQKELANMTLDRQQALQNSMLDRQLKLEQWKIDNDPQRMILKQLMASRGQGNVAPNPIMTPAPPDLVSPGISIPGNAPPQIPTDGIPQVSMSELQAPPTGGNIPPPALPQQTMQPQGGVDPILTYALTSKFPEGYALNAQGQPVMAPNKELLKATGERQAELQERMATLPQLEDTVKRLGELGQKATYTIPGQIVDWSRKQVGADPREGALARAEYISLIDNQILPLLRQTFGAQFTQKEGESLKATLGDPDMHPQEKEAVLRSFIDQKKATINSMQRQLGGQPQNNLLQEARDAIAKGADPNLVEQRLNQKGLSLRGPQ